MLLSLWRSVTELCFPARCIGCGVRGTPLCPTCRRDLPWLPDGVCPRCAAWRSAGACRGCRLLSPRVSTVHAAFAYEGAARAAVLTLKFRGGKHLGPVMGELLRQELGRRPLHADVVAPVPLSRERLRERGYNQALLLAVEIAAATRGTVVADALRREHRAPQQTLSATQRRTNLDGAIACVRPDLVRSRRVVLVDDVVTTGATVSSCAEALVRAGAARVSAVAFARDL